MSPPMKSGDGDTAEVSSFRNNSGCNYFDFSAAKPFRAINRSDSSSNHDKR